MKCANCGSQETHVVLDIKNENSHYLTPNKTNGNRKWHKCVKCGIAFSTPRLTLEEIEWMYKNYRNISFRNETPDEYFKRITSLPKDKSENYQKYSYIHESLINFQPLNILDIGCGGGVLIHELKKHWNSAKYFGIEPSPNYAELASRKTYANIINGYFSSATKYETKFDLITCCHVLEHIEDFNKFITAMKSNLNDNGYIYLEVPDYSDFMLLEKNHSRFTEPSHLWYFSEVSLNRIVKNNGLEIERCEVKTSIRGKRNLIYILK